MCGIFGIINYYAGYRRDYLRLMNSFELGKNRGPEYSIIKNYENFYLGFHRLAINGLNTLSNQPFEIDNIILICNGEIYNFRELAKNNNITLTTDSDCEIILHLYKLFGIEYTLNLLDGVFSFILYDKNNKKFYIARDPYGVRPLYYMLEHNIMAFASELKVLYKFPSNKKNIYNFLPGNFMILDNESKTPFIYYNYKKYTAFPCNNIIYPDIFIEDLYRKIYNNICSAVKKRVVGTTERPIACLLSGGLDSSLIAALVNRYYNQSNANNPYNTKKLHTFSIGLKDSQDLKYAKIVANHINSIHHEIVVTENEFFKAIPEVIKAIESYDTTTVRASVGNYLVAKHIKNNTDCKVIFNGDGADELMGGYLYMKKAPTSYEFDKECRRLLEDIHMFDVLRSDKSISSNGLEPRTPFLDKSWVEFYLSIDRNLRYKTTIENCEKYLIRKSFSFIEPTLLPKEILWRTKEAFSDGVSGLNRSWFEIIQEKISDIFLSRDNSGFYMKTEIDTLMKFYKNIKISNNLPDTYEKAYYRYFYNKYYQNTDHLIEYYWMPKYIDAKDASARTLNVYNENNNNVNNNNVNDTNNDTNNDTIDDISFN